jgi:hypothetical protein
MNESVNINEERHKEIMRQFEILYSFIEKESFKAWPYVQKIEILKAEIHGLKVDRKINLAKIERLEVKIKELTGSKDE